MTNQERKMSLRDRLFEHLPSRPENGCWEWKGYKEERGYGRLKYYGKRLGAHRAMMLVEHGEIPQGKVVMHLCHNKICCNPKHLKIGTQRENIIMDFERGAQSAKGANNVNAKLTAREIKEIRDFRSKNYSLHQIARLYSVSHSTIWQISVGRLWSHVV